MIVVNWFLLRQFPILICCCFVGWVSFLVLILCVWWFGTFCFDLLCLLGVLLVCDMVVWCLLVLLLKVDCVCLSYGVACGCSVLCSRCLVSIVLFLFFGVCFGCGIGFCVVLRFVLFMCFICVCVWIAL